MGGWPQPALIEVLVDVYGIGEVQVLVPLLRASERLIHQTSVKALCSFTSKRGDLDMRFTPALSALDSMQGQRIAALMTGAYHAPVIYGTHSSTIVTVSPSGTLARINSRSSA